MGDSSAMKIYILLCNFRQSNQWGTAKLLDFISVCNTYIHVCWSVYKFDNKKFIIVIHDSLQWYFILCRQETYLSWMSRVTWLYLVYAIPCENDTPTNGLSLPQPKTESLAKRGVMHVSCWHGFRMTKSYCHYDFLIVGPSSFMGS